MRLNLKKKLKPEVYVLRQISDYFDVMTNRMIDRIFSHLDNPDDSSIDSNNRSLASSVVSHGTNSTMPSNIESKTKLDESLGPKTSGKNTKSNDFSYTIYNNIDYEQLRSAISLFGHRFVDILVINMVTN